MKLVNIGIDAVSLYRPAGEAGSLTVEPDQECEIPGELVTEAPEGVELPSDGLLVRLPDGDYRVFSSARWRSADSSAGDKPTVAATVVDAPIVNQEPNPAAEPGSTVVPGSAATPKDEG